MSENNFEKVEKSIFEWMDEIDGGIGGIFDEWRDDIKSSIKKPFLGIQARIRRVREVLLGRSGEGGLYNEIQGLIDKAEVLRKIVPSLDESTPNSIRARLAALASTIARGNELLFELRRISPVSAKRQDIDNYVLELERRVKDLTSKVAANEKRSQIIGGRIDGIVANAKSSVENIANECRGVEKNLEEKMNLIDTVILHIREKEEEVNKLVGVVSGTSIHGNYSESAKAELKWADATRNGSVFLMLAIALLVGYSLLETSSPHFDWQTAIFRLVFSLALSVPAAYLSRESSKHRFKQYEFQKMALDLQAMSPYLASLPADEQNKIKVEMANRIFVSAGNQIAQDSYPLDLQVILLKLLDKVPSGVKSDNADKNDSINKKS